MRFPENKPAAYRGIPIKAIKITIFKETQHASRTGFVNKTGSMLSGWLAGQH
jgi:hypothetical protein